MSDVDVDLDLSKDQIEIKAWAREFAEKEIRPVAAEYDETEKVPWDLINKAAKAGFFGYPYPEEYGGLGLTSILTKCVILEELAWGCAGVADIIGATHLAGTPMMKMGSPEQLKKWISIISNSDKANLAAYCLTEPEAGSDVANMRTSMRRDGDEYVINGRKCFITNGGIAEVYFVFATHDRSLRHKGISAFIIPAGTPGLSAGKKEKKLGTRCAHTGDVIFEDVRVPIENRFSEEGKGFLGAMRALEEARVTMAATALGVAQAAFDYALAYSKERKTFGQPIAKHQAIAFMLADMATQIAAARALTWQAARVADSGAPLNQIASMAKIMASDVAVKVTTDAVQIFGGYGYIRDYPVEKLMRDAKIKQIYEGTNQIQRTVIAKELIGRD
ncbi:acyl-CoA dehydrogenase family protein [Candidatus Chlorohelix allophototropha]|uniref:Acyl-CoA dehydrogenase family protein n=1 Tax=Candidatus Chlorohelix allophototropha TaxID=3003348 RepID=A0ABY9B4S6_9CHLR|nr:acyl-CoA dehydrogenase family protein [Chloroflexota bacterium L227-S17]